MIFTCCIQKRFFKASVFSQQLRNGIISVFNDFSQILHLTLDGRLFDRVDFVGKFNILFNDMPIIPILIDISVRVQ